jgi:hypothetical protein
MPYRIFELSVQDGTVIFFPGGFNACDASFTAVLAAD